MYTEVTYSTQIFLPSIVAGVLLLSAGVSGVLMMWLRKKVYGATFVCLLNSFAFTLCGGIINYLGDLKMLGAGLQVSRFEQIFATAYIPAVAFLVYAFDTTMQVKLRRIVFQLTLAAFVALTVIAFVWPDWFVSVTTVTPEAEFKEASFARGMQGSLYVVRDVILAVIFVYAVTMLGRMYRAGVAREIIGPVITGTIIAMLLGLNDILNVYTWHKMLLPPALDFSYSSLGMGIFGVLVAYGAFRYFMAQLTQSELNYGSTRDLMREVVDAMDSVVIGIDERRRVVLWNSQASQRWSLLSEEALGRQIENVVPTLSQEVARLDLVMQSKQSLRDEKRIVLSTGEYSYEDIRVFPLVSQLTTGAVLIMTDISEKKRLHETIIQTEKMISIGGLAAGMAHEINNPLAGIMQNAQLAQTRMLKRTAINEKAAENAGISFDAVERYMNARRIPEILAAIMKAGQRANQVIRNMLDFSREDTGDVSHVRITELIDSVLDIARNDWDLKQSYDFKNINIVRDYDHSLPEVPCENQNVAQVFFNIIRNAAQAIYEAKPDNPTITLRTKMGADNMVRVEIDDNGNGIPAFLQNRVFDPFFTTKEVGEGTGLGLSVSYFIVTEHHKGHIGVVSPPGGGTRFWVELPIQRSSVNGI